MTTVTGAVTAGGTVYPCSATITLPGGLPPGVTLQPADGGPSYYSDHGFTVAHAAGWDNPSFFPVGVWYGMILTQADVNRWKDLGLNTAFRCTSNTVMPLLQSNGLGALVSAYAGTLENPGMGSETVGLLAADEPSSMADWESAVQKLPNSLQDTRFWWVGNTWNFVAYGGLSPLDADAQGSIQALNTTVASPGGRLRHIDIQSMDIYWFAEQGNTYEGNLIYKISNMTVDQSMRGCLYGDMIDRLRAFQAASVGGYPAPIIGIVENGGPLIQNTTTASYITPPQMNWAIWSMIIHGARGIEYFNHTFGGPQQGNDNFAQTFYQTVQPGQTISIYAQAKATNALIAQLAPVINAPTALGYVTTSRPPVMFGGIDTMAKYYGGQFYVFAATRESQKAVNLATTFTTADHYTGPVTVTGENRTIPAVNGVFTDTFATGATVHIYQIP